MGGLTSVGTARRVGFGPRTVGSCPLAACVRRCRLPVGTGRRSAGAEPRLPREDVPDVDEGMACGGDRGRCIERRAGRARLHARPLHRRDRPGDRRRRPPRRRCRARHCADGPARPPCRGRARSRRRCLRADCTIPRSSSSGRAPSASRVDPERSVPIRGRCAGRIRAGTSVRSARPRRSGHRRRRRPRRWASRHRGDSCPVRGSTSQPHAARRSSSSDATCRP